MYFLSACSDSNFLSVILLAKNLLEIITIIVPIILIIMLAIDFCKIVFGDVKIVPKVAKSITIRVVAAVAIFFVPTLVTLLLSLLDQVNFKASACWLNANTDTITEFRAVEEANKLQEQEALGKEAAEAATERERVEAIREEARKENEKKAEEATKNSLSGTVVDNVVQYFQGDYGNEECLAGSGCGPTSAAVIASTFLGSSGHTPVDAAIWIRNHGGYTCASGSVFSVVASYLTNLGLNTEGIYSWTTSNITMLKEKLASGNYMAIVLVHAPSCAFTKGGHYFVLYGITNDEFKIVQVSSRAQTQQTWPVSSISSCSDVSFYLFSKK